ncbi:two-component system nitrate/nitrite response regulator NarL [Altererythrobacter atlanticus]|nr:two-component system nitrate/nitrite response regulator NarL [Croceibacterium atlanticum]
MHPAPEGSDDTLIVLVDQSAQKYEDDEVFAIRNENENARFVFLTEQLNLEYMTQAFRLGAHGFILKSVGCESLLGSLRLVALGEKVLPGALAEKLPSISSASSVMVSKESSLDTPLSDRETEILSCLVIGLPNKLIARRLDLSEATVKVHVKGILRKLGVQNRTQAAIYALNNGFDSTFRTSSQDYSPVVHGDMDGVGAMNEHQMA